VSAKLREEKNMLEELTKSSFRETIEEIIKKIRQSQLEVFQNANQIVLDLYFYIGNIINNNIQWGNKFIDDLSIELKIKFPNAKGYSPRNLRNMRKYYLSVKDNKVLKELSYKIPWSHNSVIMDRIKDDNQKIWYIEETYNNGWSYDYLETQIKRDAYSRQILGEKPNNFNLTLLQPQSLLAKEIMKDPYIFDVGELRENFVEKDIENALIDKIKMTLLELGNGFSFIANQYRVVVNDEENYIDLLFYHTKLHCYIAIELKNKKFIPEYVGKMNYYLSALDESLKNEQDNPSIGIILVRNKNKLNVEYALRDINKPIGVSSYELSEYLPSEIIKELPTEDDLNLHIDISS